ncbi:aspartyl/asparaginyl beta-hydroxylase domain-containing protein [Sphingomonas nostoxanthinifaciens]|uniref:aspartyl/asparaginyl beta-hydroxylase domain-containing protein n=1 Tax=Sphingomonas nostoxanthinifaciens TaxID=2872652 RepID=UPI001CC1D8B3|nr:aspartyl/asparaginyl beta-hydroxylase domain-containing protein [Sphingomonas nostoxanthinifaciens]UAK23787.1 aspartyl/asparaginyl beta-hydroxylase domain-containing protein [Sphingomonas nostoxanthinifaciens]
MSQAAEEAQRLMTAAANARNRHETAEEIALLEQVVALVPEHAAAHNALGMRALAASEFERAQIHFAHATAADPGAIALWLNLAAAARGLGDVATERDALLHALENDRRDLTTLVRLAELRHRQGDLTEAAMRWSEVLAVAQAQPERSPALEALMQRASAFVARRNADIARQVKDALTAVPLEHSTLARRRVDAAIAAMFGQRAIYTNVCSGLHVPFLPADEFFDRDLFPWLPQIEEQTDVIRQELLALLADDRVFEPYVTLEAGAPPNLWSPLDRSPDWTAFHLWRHGEALEHAQTRCPRTAAALSALPLARVSGRMPTAFFSLLKPKAHIPAHTGVSNVRAIVHLPLVIPPNCRFRVGGETRSWCEGKALIFDDTIEHEAWNESESLRAVLIFDVWNPHLTASERMLLTKFFDTADNQKQFE